MEATERLHQLYERDRRRDELRKVKAEEYRRQRRISSSSRAARLAKYELRRALGVEPGGRTRPEARGQQCDVAGGLKPTQGAARRAWW